MAALTTAPSLYTSGTLPLGTYHRTGTLGEGSFGSVVTVYSDEGTPFALKIFDPDEDDGTLDLGTLRELSILRVLRGTNGHPGIIQMVDVLPPSPNASTGGKIGMVMPMYKVGDLARILDGGGLPSGGAGRRARIAIAHGLLSAVAYLSDNAVMHRDIKADNVMLTDTLRPVLIDFSLGKVLDGPMSMLPPGRTHTPEIGTPTYIAPEVVSRLPYGTKADAWSVGVVLLEMLRGHTLECEKDARALKLVAEAKLALPDKPFANMVRGLLETDPDQRASCRQALSAQVFMKAGLAVPEVRLIDWDRALPEVGVAGGSLTGSDVGGGSSENTSSGNCASRSANAGGGRKRERAASSASSSSSNSRISASSGVTINKTLAAPSALKMKIRNLCVELDCADSHVEAAALMYAHHAARIGMDLESKKSTVLRELVVLAEKFFGQEQRDLEDLYVDEDEEYPTFEGFEVDRYKLTEAILFREMDYCMYLRDGWLPSGEEMGGKGRKKKKKGNKKKQ